MGESIDDILNEFLVEHLDAPLLFKDVSRSLMDFMKKKAKKTYTFEEDEFWQNYYRNYIYQSEEHQRQNDEEDEILLQNIDHLFKKQISYYSFHHSFPHG